MGREGSSGNSTTERKRKRKSMENEIHDDYHSEAKRQKTDSSEIEPVEVSKIQPIFAQIREELINNKDAIVQPELEEETPFTLSVWDLGGQGEFISTHHRYDQR